MPPLFDPFGVAKGLRLEEWFRAEKKGVLLPPVQACVNPVHGCNLACLGCEFAPDEGLFEAEKEVMPEGHLLKVVKMLVKWGVKAVTFGTVGEPSLHPELPEAITLARLGGMDVSLITNGVQYGEELANTVMGMCSVVWVKIPAATTLTYESVTRRRLFDRVVGRKYKEPASGGLHRVKVGWLFEITSLNADEVVDACSVAKDRGFDMFLARPLRKGTYEKRRDAEEMTRGVDAAELERLGDACGLFGNERFRVHVEDGGYQGGFHQCYAAPLVIHLGANGYVYFCRDCYGETDKVIGKHYSKPELVPQQVWGGEEHLRLLREDTPHWCTVDCALVKYHKMARTLVWEEEDPLLQWQITI